MLLGSQITAIKIVGTVKIQRKHAGAHHEERTTTPYSCHDVFTDRSIFSLNLSRIQIPTGTSVTNYNHMHGLMCDVDMFT